MKSKTFCLLCALIMTLSASAQEADNVLKYGLKFLNTPYVAHTLEVNNHEKLVVNCNEVDCTTFVEYVLAKALSPTKKGKIENADFRKNLQLIRYRNGKIDGYSSRLHYIADWINNGIKQGVMEDVTAANSTDTVRLSLNFMSTHPKSYKQMAHSSKNVNRMKKIEESLSGQICYYIPKEKLSNSGLPWIKAGDIIAITTNITGLDVAHLGIAIDIEGQLKLLHASSTEKKVVITKGSLAQMLMNNKTFTGVRVLRMRN